MASTIGHGGPCPNCEEMNCLIKKGTGLWFTFIACPTCYFAYGENADTMREKQDGVVAGAEVWVRVIEGEGIEDISRIEDWKKLENDTPIESPFKFSKEDKHWLYACMISKKTLIQLIP